MLLVSLKREHWVVILRVKPAVIFKRRIITWRSTMKFSKSNVSGVSVLAPTVDTRMDLVPNNTKLWWRRKAADVQYAATFLRMECCALTTVILLVKSAVFCVDTVILLWVI